ncbi:type II toxin-antitoxin system RelE/ParE family toxin [Asticcacaulis sp.]|uniref:type II toxin-antitoxin system RelE/ParE family toxin n=1 Tax=Asticcacaulis sp. TaxID=1872648 RepID=UPI003F7C5A0D
MRDIRIFAAAELEITEARAWYDSESPGLGDRFIDELDPQLERIAAAPDQFPCVLRDVRRARLHIFPYAIFFREKGTAVFVISCFHSSRNPRAWKHRA